MALARAELTGPSLSRLKPKLQETALALWGLYLALTLLNLDCCGQLAAWIGSIQSITH